MKYEVLRKNLIFQKIIITYNNQKITIMNTKMINNFKQTLIVPLGAFIALILFSFTLGWNILTLLLFWFLFIPFLASTLPTIISKNEFNLRHSIIGLIIFYSFMVFMIYEHYQSDYFIIMLISLICNIGAVSLITWIRKNVS